MADSITDSQEIFDRQEVAKAAEVWADRASKVEAKNTGHIFNPMQSSPDIQAEMKKQQEAVLSYDIGVAGGNVQKVHIQKYFLPGEEIDLLADPVPGKEAETHKSAEVVSADGSTVHLKDKGGNQYDMGLAEFKLRAASDRRELIDLYQEMDSNNKDQLKQLYEDLRLRLTKERTERSQNTPSL